ncbi:MAG: Protoheme IX farnesyltransferase, mitochondrial [Thelocarpon impressellum]|nr:MAG: Protoheme IX farnesyltransferase, mitochondrial [Thelocarpon impressellum]
MRPGPRAIIGPGPYGSVCSRCLSRLSRTTRAFSKTTPSKNTAAVVGIVSRAGIFRKEYFLANGFLDRADQGSRRGTLDYAVAGVRPRSRAPDNDAGGMIGGNQGQQADVVGSRSSTGEEAARDPPEAKELPHRRKQRLRQEGVEKEGDPAIPLDASHRLSTLSAAMPSRSVRRLLTTYMSLSKPRLSFLIVLTTTTAYSLYPVPALLLPSTTAAPSLSTLTLLFLTTGTALVTASANTLNMLIEPAHDAKMSRTRNRPLVRKLISPRGALGFAVLTGAFGLGALYYGVNPTVAFLGGLNIALYAGVYTPLKRVSVINTWVGAVVGGVPPLMGWAAAAGQSASGSGGWQELLFSEGSAGGWLLAGLLFAWQFPHFNALSWAIRDDYRAAGHRMLCWVNPRQNGRVALRYSLLCFPVCAGLWWAGVTDAGFLVTSSVANGWLVREAWRFYRREGHGGTARGLFWASVWHLPVVMVLAMAHKQGLWAGLYRSALGRGEASMEEDYMDDGESSEEPAAEKQEGRALGVPSSPPGKALPYAAPVLSR